MCIRDSDNYLQAMRIAETPDVRLPIMICQDGFITSHAVENILLEEDEKVKAFVGEYQPENYLLKHDNPLAVGPYDTCPYYMEHKMQQAVAMKNAKKAVLAVAADFEKTFGRHYGFFEEYRMEDAEAAIVLIGSTAGTARACVDQMRAAGKKVGMIKLRVFRPFPAEELAAALAHVKAVAVMDKSEGFSGTGGPVYAETAAACYDLENRPKLINVVYGLGGRDCTVSHVENVFNHLFRIIETCLLYTSVFAVAYLPFAFRTQTDPIQLIFACVLACIVPVSLCAHSFSDPKLIKSDLTYVLTNYRAFVIGDERANMMRIDKDTDYRTEMQEDGTEIIYIGDACKTKASSSRANTVLGVRKDKENPSKITGLVFYGVKDAADVCSKYAAFAR